MSTEKATAKKDKSTKAAVAKRPAAKKVATRKKAAAPVTATHEEIAVRAYFISLEGGEDALRNWLQAEEEMSVS